MNNDSRNQLYVLLGSDFYGHRVGVVWRRLVTPSLWPILRLAVRDEND